MGIESHTLDYSEERASRVSSLCQKMKSTREKMEKETRIFIEAAKNFSLEWVQREMNINVPPLKSEGYSGNEETGKDRLSGLPRLEDSPFRIQEIVEDHLNRDNYWIHRSELLHADVSRDYIEFKKEKIRKDLTSSIRMILGCAAEIFADQKNENPEGRVWVKERGRRKYICILRFSSEMTVSLDHYFTMLEELLILGYEMKEIENEVEEGKIKEK
ncbi:hypothetical protein FXV91_06120 [Methanosarcina sp. DH2]|uniref:hypothetical protein n=1 Tax=Methanosarcina sp. DH2 TaxID=2605639 RepID=UPI001E304359|nr:hypothetical protein [Methanosarcina sp. DH2]MCC4769790.1 hypothetical protein [Methanosarcina sp. DH2]